MPAILKEVLAGVLVHMDGSNVGVLRDGSTALLVNAGNPGLGAALRGAGIERVEQVLFTHHRRELADGLADLPGAPPAITVPKAEAALFADPAAYWADRRSRWYALCQHVPYHVTHATPLPVARTVAAGDTWQWHDWSIRVLATPGYTDGSVSYLVSRGGQAVAFTGDLIYGPGQIRDFYCLQHEQTRSGYTVGDYHGFLGTLETVVASLETVKAARPDRLVPAHGVVMDQPPAAADLLVARLREAYGNYVRVSALRWYFPRYFEPFPADAGTLPQQQTAPLPANVRRVRNQAWLLVAASRRALLLDPCCEASVTDVQALLDKGEIAGLDGIWITHYHCDHVEAAALARARFGCPLLVDRSMADIIDHPRAHFMTCLTDRAATVDRATADGETWRWEEFTLTAWHFPGQTLYHGGLLAATPDGQRLFFAGDSFTPTGIDDYCAWNRNFLGPGVGFRRCLDVLRTAQPTWIFNPHVEVGFHFTDDAYARIEQNLVERERLFAALLPWDHPDFGTDECWVYPYPYEQDAAAGATVPVEVRVANHAPTPKTVTVGLRPPPGWESVPPTLSAACPPKSEARLRLHLRLPVTATPGRRVIPVTVVFGGQDLGTFREVIVNTP